VVRNGDALWVARTVAVEFEMIYGVSHPGRARLHGFGIFGGSNGYWRTALLRQTRFRGSMLTEDIDSALRVVEAGYRIGSDPYLITHELAPTTVRQLWDQRMRWSQGWFQVSLGHLRTGLTSRILTPQQKFNFLFLLGWREVYPWLSVQMVPILGYHLARGERLDWLVPVFVLTTLLTLSVGPFQTLFAYRQGASADPRAQALVLVVPGRLDGLLHRVQERHRAGGAGEAGGGRGGVEGDPAHARDRGTGRARGGPRVSRLNRTSRTADACVVMLTEQDTARDLRCQG
jgi:hypothetical protein